MCFRKIKKIKTNVFLFKKIKKLKKIKEIKTNDFCQR